MDVADIKHLFDYTQWANANTCWAMTRTLQILTSKSIIDDIRADDLCLISACEKGDERAWEDLVSNFDSTVKSAARKISSNNEDAEGLASSIWAELYGLRVDADGNKKSKLAYYSGRGSLSGWLRAVVSQLAEDHFRKQSKFVQIEEDREFENLANEGANNDNNHFGSHTESPEELFAVGEAESDVSDALRAAIGELDAEDRLILKLYYFDDLKLKDIAATFGYHEATASRKLTRVQSEIRKGVEKNLREQHGWSDTEVTKTPVRHGRKPRAKPRNDVRRIDGCDARARFLDVMRSVSGYENRSHRDRCGHGDI